MSKEYVLKIGFNDRLGLGYEIFSVLKDKNINLWSMEAKASEEMVIKFQSHGEKIDHLIQGLKKINGLHTIQFCDLMPYEQREHELTTILNSVSEGIIAVNKQGNITHINQMAREIFHVPSEPLEGTHVTKFLKEKIPIINTLQTGEGYQLTEIKIQKPNKTLHYLTSGVPILNESGAVIGAVATIKDYKQVEDVILKVDDKKKSFNHILYQSRNMGKVIDMARLVAQGNSSVLLRGESGTGKELFARAIHKESHRVNEPFIAINCGALPESLLESELFGYEDGAFTGAIKGGKKGLFEQANKGTLFLDEVGELSPHMQVRLLRVLQENAVRRIGSNKEMEVDVRIISATHRNLEEMLGNNRFREDLYYRLNVVPIRIPPLRERKEDIPLIAHYLIRKICKKLNKEEKYLTKDGIDFLLQSEWPGNVRQLENTLERILNVVQGKQMTSGDFIEWNRQEVTNNHIDFQSSDDDQFSMLFEFDKKWPKLKEVMNEVERELLVKVLETHDSSRKAGEVLGVSNTTILNKMKKHQIYSNTDYYYQ